MSLKRRSDSSKKSSSYCGTSSTSNQTNATVHSQISFILPSDKEGIPPVDLEPELEPFGLRAHVIPIREEVLILLRGILHGKSLHRALESRKFGSRAAQSF